MSLNNPQRRYTNTNALNISTLQHPNVRIDVDPFEKKKQRKNPTSFVYIFKPRGSSIEDQASFQ